MYQLVSGPTRHRVGCRPDSRQGYQGQVWFFRIAAFVVPFFLFLLVMRTCEELSATETHTLRSAGSAVRRDAAGGSEEIPAAELGGEREPARKAVPEGPTRGLGATALRRPRTASACRLRGRRRCRRASRRRAGPR